MLIGLSACKGGCGSKTPVPFKRGPAETQAELAPTAQPPTRGTSYGDETQSIQLEGSAWTRSEGSFRAALPIAAAGAPASSVLVVSSDAQASAKLETWAQADSVPSRRSSLPLAAAPSGCTLADAGLSRLGPALALASLDMTCAQEPAAGGIAIAPDAPPEPGTLTHEMHQFVLELDSAEGTVKPLLHLVSLPPSDPGDALGLTLNVTSQDQDQDGHPDLQVSAELTHPADGATTRVPLLWLNRPSGLARERGEPEHSLAVLADEAFKLAAREPLAALPLAQKVLAAHRALCHESGSARLLVDETVGLGCGVSSAAGRAAVVRALALAKQQQLLPALQARAELDSQAYRVEAGDRERVAAALAAIRGQTSYTWQRGPDLLAPSAPSVRLPALGFADDDQLLLRGAVAQSFDLRTQVATPTSIAHGVVMSHPGGRFAVVDVLADCDGHYLRVVPGSAIVSGFVAAKRGIDVSLGTDQADLPGCSPRVRRSDHSGFVVLGLSGQGAVVAQGIGVRLVPLDANGGSAGPPRVLAAEEAAPALLAPGALSQTGLRHALATSEGVALVDRGAHPGTTLVRSPASCTGRISDVALSPSGTRVAMLCNGHVYWARQTQLPPPVQTMQAAPANSAQANSARPTAERPAAPAQPSH